MRAGLRSPAPFARACAAAALALALLAPAPAAGDSHALRLRFSEGRSLAQAGRWADALARFEEIARTRPTPQVLFHIAACQDRLGRLIHAERTYTRARDTAGDAAPEVAAAAGERLLGLEPRIPRLLVHLEGAVEGVELRLDGAPVRAFRVLRVDPGPHMLVALRDGVPVAAAALSTRERQTRLLRLRIYSP